MLKLEPQTLNLTSRTRSFDFPRLGVHSIVRRMFSFVFVFLKDVGAHCHCASLVRTLFIRHARATSFSSARTESKTQQNIELMTFVSTWCTCEYFCWMLGDPHFFRHITSLPDSFHYINKRKKSLRGKF